MSMQVNHLTKIYGQQKAIDDISFTINKGEIVGFLGPNGAGKSTTMKIATGFLPSTSGKVVVEGFDVADNPMHVKKIIGYLPEHNPLYLDMYVHEYLQFIGKVYQIPSHQLNGRVKEIIGMCDRVLVMREGRIVGQLEGEAVQEREIMYLATGLQAASA